MIVVSLDPVTHAVSMFSMPRDTYGLPMPPNSRLSTLWGSNFNYKLNALWEYSDRYRDLFPGGGADALKQALGYAYGLDISYYVLVNFAGFQDSVRCSIRLGMSLSRASGPAPSHRPEVTALRR
jgi:anionic cell wall polymer biosynthesis LytR-Cps2A-Psr (LCP) family protein